MDFGILLLILFILAPLLEKLLRAGRPQPPPQEQQQQRPGQPGPQARPQPRTEVEEESAAGMLPDDLWEILTGERRPTARQAPREPDLTYDEPVRTQPPAPAPAPPPRRAEARLPAQSRPMPDRSRGASERQRRLPRVEQRRLPEIDDRRLPEVEIRRPGPTVRQRSAGPPPSAADELVRRPTVHRAPAVVSLETPIEDGETRRARFHERLAATAQPRTGIPVPQSAWAFASADEVRRAIVMAEILGPPKGLE
jgi:hypothetical protein